MRDNTGQATLFGEPIDKVIYTTAKEFVAMNTRGLQEIQSFEDIWTLIKDSKQLSLEEIEVQKALGLIPSDAVRVFELV